MKKTIIITVISFLSCLQSAYSQISTNEQPISLQRGIGLLTKDKTNGTIYLPVPNIVKALSEDSLYQEKYPNEFLRTSIPILVTVDINKDGIWTTLEDGGKLWQMEIHGDKAFALDFVFSKFWIPEGGKFFIFNPSTNETIGAITSQFLSGDVEKPDRFSTGIIKGDNVVLEYYQSADIKDLPIITVEKTYYSYREIRNLFDDCEVDINCNEGLNWQMEKNAIARVYGKFVQGGKWCSGALVNNTQKDLSPLFLTANHCLEFDNSSSGGYLEVKDAIVDNNLSDWIFYWNYEIEDCSGGTLSNFHSTTGAIVKANNSVTDFALLQLQQDPLNSSNFIPYYLGWDASGNSGTGGVCIHHPGGWTKKISTYSCTPQTVSMSSSPSVYWGVQWISGITEIGSSGAPLINNYHRVIGQLSGNNASMSCSNPDGTSKYGKLSVSWTGNGNSDYRRRLDYWLNPNGSNTQVLNGLYPFTVMGSDELYSSSVYGIYNLPTGFTISWNLTGDNASNFILQSAPSTRECTLTRKENVEFSGSTALILSAQVKYYGIVVCTATKSICAPYISGDSNPCLNELYSVEGYSSGQYVTWNLSGSGYSVIPDLVPTNTEGNNYLGVHRTASSQTYASGTITATISSGGNVLGTLTKKISSAAGFSGTWYQSSSLFPPYTPDGTPEDLQCGLHTFTSGKRIIMQSDDFIGATISGNAVISHNNSIVSFPTFSGTSFTINGYVSGTCKAYQFRFLAAVDPILPLDLSINSTGSGYIFSLLEKQQGDRSEENQSKTPYSGQWQLTIMQSETGQTMYNGTTDGQSITVNTSGWRRGLYVAVARVNDSTIAQKLAIEE